MIAAANFTARCGNVTGMARRKNMLTAMEAAEMLGVEKSTFTSYVSRQQAPAAAGFDPDTGARVWRRTELEKWQHNRPGRGRWRSRPSH